MCQVLKLSSSSYYKWKNRPRSKKLLLKEKTKKQINMLDRTFIAEKPVQAWVSDITYIQTNEGFLYLTTVIDLYDRKIIGWSLSKGMSTEETSLSAWKMAVKNRKIGKSLIFHSDQGVQYASRNLQILWNSMKLQEV